MFFVVDGTRIFDRKAKPGTHLQRPKSAKASSSVAGEDRRRVLKEKGRVQGGRLATKNVTAMLKL